MPKQTSLFPDDNYADFLNSLKQRIRTAQVRAALAVNQQLVLLYWQIGREILTRQGEQGWGSSQLGFRPTKCNRSFLQIFRRICLQWNSLRWS